MKKILWAVIGGAIAFILLIAFVITLLFSHFHNFRVQSNCDAGIDAKHCNFVTVVRDTGKYFNKSDAAVATYGDEMCSTMRSSELGKQVVEGMEDPLIVSAAKHNLCTDVN